MTLIEFEGFETLDPLQLTARGFAITAPSGTSALAAATNGRYGGRTMTGGGNALFTFTKAIGATRTDLYFGMASYNNEAVPASVTPLFRALSGANLMGQITVDVNRNVLAQNRSGTTIGASLGVLPYSQWNWIEAHFHMGTTSANGTWEAYVNGVLWGTRTGDLGGGTYAGADTFAWGNGFRSSYMDDCYVADTSGSFNNGGYLGEWREVALLPTGAGAHTDFTPSTGANWAAVDEVPPNGDTDYVASLTPGHLDSYVYGNLPATTNTVLAVAPRLWARKDDAATRQIADLAVIGGVDYAGSVTQTLTGSYVQYQQIHEASPATGVAWTPTEVNGAEFGIDLVA